MPGVPEPLYVLARRVLLDALQALGDQNEAVILVGAQAVYLHTGEADLAVAEYMIDGDIAIDPAASPLGVCTSSATVGPSVSLGKADAAVVVARTAALADAVASAVGNRVRTRDDIGPALELGTAIDGVTGVVVVMGETLGVKGDIEIAPVFDIEPV